MKKRLSIFPKKLSRHIFYFLGVFFAVITLLPSISAGQFGEEEFPYEIQGQVYVPTDNASTDVAAELIKPDTNTSTSILKRLTDFFRLSGTTYYEDGTSKANNYVKRILNILLGLVSFLSLVMIIYAFYLIFFSKGEEGVGKARKILIGVVIALAIMGLSWFIASYFFEIYNIVT